MLGELIEDVPEEFLKRGSYVVISTRDSEYGLIQVSEIVGTYEPNELGEAIEQYQKEKTAALLVVVLRKGEKDFPER